MKPLHRTDCVQISFFSEAETSHGYVVRMPLDADLPFVKALDFALRDARGRLLGMLTRELEDLSNEEA